MSAPTRIRTRNGTHVFVPLPVEDVRREIQRAASKGLPSVRLGDHKVLLQHIASVDPPSTPLPQRSATSRPVSDGGRAARAPHTTRSTT